MAAKNKDKKVFVVLYETHDYDKQDVETEVQVFENREDAVKALDQGVIREICDSNYDEDDISVVRDGDDYVAFCDKLTDDWFFRITIYERVLN